MSAMVLVVVVTWNAMRWIDRCLGSVADCGANADVMVVDNSSTDPGPNTGTLSPGDAG